MNEIRSCGKTCSRQSTTTANILWEDDTEWWWTKLLLRWFWSIVQAKQCFPKYFILSFVKVCGDDCNTMSAILLLLFTLIDTTLACDLYQLEPLQRHSENKHKANYNNSPHWYQTIAEQSVGHKRWWLAYEARV